MHRSFLKQFPLFIWLLFASLRCLISTLTQAGGGGLYLGSLVQFSPATGRVGRCRQTSLCVGSTPRVPATLGLPCTGVYVLSPSTLLRLPAALHGAGPALSAVPVFRSSTKAQRLRLRFVSSPASAVQAARGLGALSPDVARFFPPQRAAQAARGLGELSPGATRLFPPWRAARAARGLGALSPGCGSPLPSAAPARAAGRVSGSLQTGPGACLPGGRGWLLWG